MIRMQVQLTERQAESLRRLSARTGTPIAALVREAVAQRLADEAEDAAWERALGAVGAFESGSRDTSVSHDRYLAEAFAAGLR
ncbi:MAG: ribbon-helix-helix domain-containing protein [Solirubrobacteraceae bacterium]